MIFRPSGGALYHWRAWRNGRRWGEFRRDLATWLDCWNCPEQELVLIGPSAGYTLSTPWLKRFGKVTAYDLDPLAPHLFRRRHSSVTVSFRRVDVFWMNKCLSLVPIRELLVRHGQATLLFSNVLGQLLLEGSAGEEEWQRFLLNLRTELNGRVWASYHDLFTHESGQVIDHLMHGDWKKGLEQKEFRWPLTDRCLHLVEGVRPAE